MNSSSLQEVKNELLELSQKELLELCLRLAKYKKDNKEYLAYLLFQSHDRTGFIREIKNEIDTRITELKGQKNPYPIRKGLRAILRLISKYCKYMNDKTVNAEFLIFFLLRIKQTGLPMDANARLRNLFDVQVKKIRSLISTFHEDLQADYRKELDEILAYN